MSAADLYLSYFEMHEPIGVFSIVTDGKQVLALDFGDPELRLLPLMRKRFGTPDVRLQAARRCIVGPRLRDYFAGDFNALDGLAVDGGGTDFQQRVWAALRDIAPGTTRSYGELAKLLGSPGAARAVGLANSLNPISLIVPCHRVIGSSGALTGYAGGMALKRWLLDFESGQLGRAQISLL
ncbi:methylated-DNA--[protein]-cysteine S-methyltransferase [Pseudomonas sp. LRF_L74]|uniref:methylated-DNA--[protein]-cysteine S-methyltransferase n=1 Tax=Pseudomonas sp. LRF_L74 TaxID=3369422 RepID=UPI003F5DB49F